MNPPTGLRVDGNETGGPHPDMEIVLPIRSFLYILRKKLIKYTF